MDLDSKKEKYGPKRIHKVLAHSYAFSFIALLLGLLLDFIFPLNILKGYNDIPAGVIFIILGSLLIFWAQRTSNNFSKENLTKENFSKGPYKFTRTPTHWGLFLLMLGFGVVANTLFVLIFNLISFILSKIFFL